MICYNVENMRTSSRLPESEKKVITLPFYDILSVLRKFCKTANVKKQYLMEMHGSITFFIYRNIRGNFDVCWIL